MNDWGQVLTAMATPFDEKGGIDEPAVAKLVDHLFENGSDGIVISGTTGESPTLTVEEKLRLFELVKEVANGRGPLIAGTGTNSTADAVFLSRKAQELGMDGILLVAPYYNKPSQEGLYQHFKAIADPLCIQAMLYNVPSRTITNIEAKTALRLAHDVKNIVAMKEASGNLMQVTDLLAGAPAGFKVYSGDDGLTLPMLALGAFGVVSVTSHLVGRDIQAMCAAFAVGDHERAACLHRKMTPIVKACFQPTTPSPAPLKAALNMLGLSAGQPRLPLVEANEQEQAVMRSALQEYGLL